LHTNQAKRQRLKVVSLGTSKPTHKANPQSKIYCTPTKQNGKDLKSCFAWNYKATTKQTHKGNLLHSKQGKAVKV